MYKALCSWVDKATKRGWQRRVVEKMALSMSKTWALRKWVLRRWVLWVEATKFLQMHIRSLSKVRMAGHVLRSFQSWRESAQHSLEIQALVEFKAITDLSLDQAKAEMKVLQKYLDEAQLLALGKLASCVIRKCKATFFVHWRNYSHRNVWRGCQVRRGQAVFRNRLIFAAFWQWSEGIGGHELNGTNRFLYLSDKEDPGGGALALPALHPQVLTLLALLVQKYKY